MYPNHQLPLFRAPNQQEIDENLRKGRELKEKGLKFLSYLFLIEAIILAVKYGNQHLSDNNQGSPGIFTLVFALIQAILLIATAAASAFAIAGFMTQKLAEHGDPHYVRLNEATVADYLGKIADMPSDEDTSSDEDEDTDILQSNMSRN